MEKQTTVIEISHGFIKIAIGGVVDDKPFVNYVKKIPTDHFIENTVVTNKEALVETLRKNNPLNDEKYHINHLLDEVVLILPPYGLEIYGTKQLFTVISRERIITEQDIVNVYSTIANKRLPVNNELVDIILESFEIDNGEKYNYPPIGKPCRTFHVDAKVYTLPKKVINEYVSILKEAGIKANHLVVSSYASNELLCRDDSLPRDYFLLDIGKDVSSVSIIGSKRLVATRNFRCGANDITEKIIGKFNINEKEAENLKLLYGLDNRKMVFQYPIVDKMDTKHYGDELNETIINCLDQFLDSFNNAIGQIALQYHIENYRELPIILIGGGSKLVGLIPYLKNKLGKENIYTFTPSILGARDSSLTALIGALLADEYRANEKEDAVSVVNEPLTREE